MHYRYPSVALAFLAFVPAATAVEPAELKPGLVATFVESADGRAGTTVTRLEPTVALALNANETPHPRMRVNALTTWNGHINVIRPGKYTFSATLRGGALTVKISGKRVFTTTADDKAAVTKAGEAVTLEGGVQSIEVDFVR